MRIIVIVLLSACLWTASCERDGDEAINPIPADYKSWHKPLAKPIEYKVVGHGNSRRIIYANRLALQAGYVEDNFGKQAVSYPDGAIIIKEIYPKKDSGGYESQPQLVAMVKNRAHKQSQDGWLYYSKGQNNPQPKLITSRICSGCHEAANESHPYFDGNPENTFRDYVFVKLKAP